MLFYYLIFNASRITQYHDSLLFSPNNTPYTTFPSSTCHLIVPVDGRTLFHSTDMLWFIYLDPLLRQMQNLHSRSLLETRASSCVPKETRCMENNLEMRLELVLAFFRYPGVIAECSQSSVDCTFDPHLLDLPEKCLHQVKAPISNAGAFTGLAPAWRVRMLWRM